MSISKPETSEATIDQAPIVEKSEELTTSGEPTPSIKADQVKSDTKEDDLVTHGESKDKAIERLENLVVKDQLSPAIEPVETTQVKERSPIIESETKENTDVSGASTSDQPIKEDEDIIPAETLEETKVDTTPIEPESDHQKEEKLASKSEEPTAQAGEAFDQPEIQHEEPIHAISIPEVSSAPIVPQTPENSEGHVKQPESASNHENDVFVHVQQSKEVPSGVSVGGDKHEPTSVPERPAPPSKEVLQDASPEPDVKSSKADSPSIPESAAPVVEIAVSEDSPKKIAAEPIVESVRSEPSQNSAAAIQEDVALDQPKEILPEPEVAKPSEEAPKLPASKDIQLPLTVEHVSQPVTPSTEKSEPTSKDPKPISQEAESSTSPSIKASEIAVPAVLAAAVATSSIAKAISPVSEQIQKPPSPTHEDLAHIHRSMPLFQFLPILPAKQFLT